MIVSSVVFVVAVLLLTGLL